jgi:hypothetical protein
LPKGGSRRRRSGKVAARAIAAVRRQAAELATKIIASYLAILHISAPSNSAVPGAARRRPSSTSKFAVRLGRQHGQ